MHFRLRDFRAKFLGEIGLAARPPQHPIQKRARRVVVRTQPTGEGLCIRWGEIAKFDSMPNVKGCDSFVANQVTRSCDAEQAKSESLKFRIFWPVVVTFANACEEFVGAEFLEAANGVDFVHEDNERFAFTFQIHFLDCAHEAIKWRASSVCVPERFHFRLKT